MSDLLFSLLKAIRPRFTGYLPVRGTVRHQVLAALFVLLLCAGLFPSSSQAQVLDDSTKNRYNARTTFILREADILRADTVGRMIDTTLVGLPQQRYWTHDSTYQQDLGNFGTASRRLLWEPNTQLGARLGRNVFDKYVRNAATVPYYDTRSPYTFFRFHQGNPYEQVFELSYTRSLKKHFNAGFAYERFGSNKSLAVSNTKTGHVEHNNFLFFVRYQSPDDRYNAVANFSTARHRAVEQGGIQPRADADLERSDFDSAGNVILSRLFEYQREAVRLSRAINRDDRDQVRLTQTYKLLGRGFTAFHTFDWSRQLNKYVDDLTAEPNNGQDFYSRILLSPTATDDRAEFRQLENTVGILGRTNTVEYRVYGRQRTFSLETSANRTPPVVWKPLQDLNSTQLFLGGTAAFRYRQFAIESAGEFKASTDLKNTEYKLSGVARLGPLSGEVRLLSYAPTLTEQQFLGNHYQWNNTGFVNTSVQQARVRAAQQLGRHYLEGTGMVANIMDLVYYDQNAMPVQSNSAQQIYAFSGRYRVNFGRVFFDAQGTYTLGAEDDKQGVRVPKLVGDGRLYYQGFLFKKALFGQVGVQTYFQSRWKPYNYSPSTQQFYIQDNFTTRNLPVADVFLSGDIKTVSVFLKMAYINQFLPQSGYFTTPYYAALPRRFQFGIRWQFFD